MRTISHVLCLSLGLVFMVTACGGGDDDSSGGGAGGTGGSSGAKGRSSGSSGTSGTTSKGGSSGSSGSSGTSGTTSKGGSGGSSGSSGTSGGGSSGTSSVACTADQVNVYDVPECKALFTCIFNSVCAQAGDQQAACEAAVASSIGGSSSCIPSSETATVKSECVQEAMMLASSYPDCAP